MDNIKIRKTKINDAGNISSLVINTIKKINSKHSNSNQISVWIKRNNIINLEKKLSDKERENFVSILNDKTGKIVGYATMSKNKILNLYVDASLTGKGIGKTLLNHMEKNAEKKGYKTTILDSTLAAFNFYKKNGYNEVKNIYKEVDGVEFKSVRMRKNL